MRAAILAMLAVFCLGNVTTATEPKVTPAPDYLALAAKLWKERPVLLVVRPEGIAASEVVRVIGDYDPSGSIRAVVVQPLPVLLVVASPARMAEVRDLVNALDELVNKKR
jgi:hypothetical protein